MMKNSHTEHCCVTHGCKYGDEKCPVWLGIQRQSFPCEDCGNEHPECGVSSMTIPDMPKEEVLQARNKKRRIVCPKCEIGEFSRVDIDDYIHFTCGTVQDLLSQDKSKVVIFGEKCELSIKVKRLENENKELKDKVFELETIFEIEQEIVKTLQGKLRKLQE